MTGVIQEVKKRKSYGMPSLGSALPSALHRDPYEYKKHLTIEHATARNYFVIVGFSRGG